MKKERLVWSCAGRRLSCTTRPWVMGVLNVTPDSFSDAGEFFDKKKAYGRAVAMAREGADIIDVGGESTRPGARPVHWKEEQKRVIPVIKALARQKNVLISCDTSKYEVAAAAIEAGAHIINDVTALQADPRIARECAQARTGIVLMHMRKNPLLMQRNPRYRDVIKEIRDFLAQRIDFARSRGIHFSQIAIDPGIGFGKTVTHNLAIINGLGEFARLGRPIVLGMSRKSFIGAILGEKDPRARVTGSIVAAVYAARKGANVLRVHDVAATRGALRISEALYNEKVR